MSLLSVRLSQELKKIAKDGLPAGVIRCEPKDPDNLALWEAVLAGPVGSPYEGGRFLFLITFPGEYPMKPPNVRCQTRIYHPNFSSGGMICISSLKDDWSPVMTVTTVLIGIISLMAGPNPDDPMVASIAAEFKSNNGLFQQKARAWRDRFAKDQ